MPSTLIELDKIDYDPKYYPRVNGRPDWLTIVRYTDTLLADPSYDFDPIVVMRSAGHKIETLEGIRDCLPYLLSDGLHRVRSYARAGRQRIPAEIERLPQSKWMERSVELNSRHGRALDNGDKAWVTRRLQAEGWQIPRIAELLHMRADSLERIVAERSVKITKKDAAEIKPGRSNRKIDGNHYGFLKAPMVGAPTKENILEALKSQDAVSSFDVAAVLDSMIACLRAKVINLADEDIAEKIEEIRLLMRDI